MRGPIVVDHEHNRRYYATSPVTVQQQQQPRQDIFWEEQEIPTHDIPARTFWTDSHADKEIVPGYRKNQRPSPIGTVSVVTSMDETVISTQNKYGDNPYRSDNPNDAENTSIILDHLELVNGSFSHWFELVRRCGTVLRFTPDGKRKFASVQMGTHDEAVAVFRLIGDRPWVKKEKCAFVRWKLPHGSYHPWVHRGRKAVPTNLYLSVKPTRGEIVSHKEFFSTQ